MTRKTISEIAVFIVLSAVAIAGWVRKPVSTGAASAPLNVSQLEGNQNGSYAAQKASGAAPQGNADATFTAATSESEINTPRYALTPCVSTAQPVAAYNASYYTDPHYSSNRPLRVSSFEPQSYEASYQARQTSEIERRRRGRTAKRSLALVGGSAGVGAAVGAVAGGGKGAAIGALGGGAAGFVYDRLTHKTHSGL
jgi:hypothetical protein